MRKLQAIILTPSQSSSDIDMFANKSLILGTWKTNIKIIWAENKNVLYIPEEDWDSVYVFAILQSSPRQTESQGKD